MRLLSPRTFLLRKNAVPPVSTTPMIGLSKCSGRSRRGTSTSSLSKWHAAVGKIPPSDIIPIGFGAVGNKANIAAFFGDQKINLEVSLALQRVASTSTSNSQHFKQDDVVGLKWLTEVKAEAVSNQMFALNLDQILPEQSEDFLKLAAVQPHDAGTFVEAAIEAVSTSTIPGGAEAVAELAEWLVSKAIVQGPANYKGRLLEAAGIVTSKRILDPNGPDHQPVFLAEASLGDCSAKAEGRSKLKAEQLASAKLFEILHGGSDNTFTNVQRVDFEDEVDKLDDFVEINIVSAMNLKNKEDKEGWWFRKAFNRKNAFHRAMMAPHAFPHKVSTVHAWRRQDQSSGSIVVLMVAVGVSRNNCDEREVIAKSFVEVFETSNSALANAALKVNDFISKDILGHEFDDV